MKKKFIKFSMGLCVITMFGSSSFNLNASGGGGGGGEEEHDGMKLFTVECTTKPGSWSYCDFLSGHICDLDAQHECRVQA